jgi:hypothetical protein
MHPITVMPAQAGIRPSIKFIKIFWPGRIPAFAGMTFDGTGPNALQGLNASGLAA